MAATSLLALLDDIASLLDDLAVLTKVATRKTAGVLGDDLWAKTYDAEYLALARLLRCRLLTLDGRLRRRAASVVEIVGPTEL